MAAEKMFQHDKTNTNAAHQASQMSIATFLSREIAKVTGPMAIVGGTQLQSTREGVPLAKPIGDDSQLLKLTAHVRKPGEKLMQFYARCGLGPLQIRSLTPTELARRAAIADKNNTESGLIFADPTPTPQRLTINL